MIEKKDYPHVTYALWLYYQIKIHNEQSLY